MSQNASTSLAGDRRHSTSAPRKAAVERDPHLRRLLIVAQSAGPICLGRRLLIRVQARELSLERVEPGPVDARMLVVELRRGDPPRPAGVRSPSMRPF